jgi:hypothetical protein
MSLLATLYWVLLILCVVGAFAWRGVPYLGTGIMLVLLVIIGLKLFPIAIR